MTRQEILAVAKPILFNTEMVRAILDGWKTVARRVVKAPYYIDNADVCKRSGTAMHKGTNGTHGMPYPDNPYKPGDYLYVRETWCELYHLANDMYTPVGEPCYYYAADGYNPTPFNSFPDDNGFFGDRSCPRWRPCIHMPKEAARLFLRVTEVRVERLQDITEEQIENEGIRAWSKDGVLYKYAPADCERDAPVWPWAGCPHTPRAAMKRLWDSTIKPANLPVYGWDANPWVWVIGFERVIPEEAN